MKRYVVSALCVITAFVCGMAASRTIPKSDQATKWVPTNEVLADYIIRPPLTWSNSWIVEMTAEERAAYDTIKTSPAICQPAEHDWVPTRHYLRLEKHICRNCGRTEWK